MSKPRSGKGFTLVELLLVLAIIGLLVSLMVPAIQASREAARNTQCINNQHQLGIAFLRFEGQHKAFPSSITLRAEGPLNSEPKLAMRSFFADLLPYLDEGSINELYDRGAMFGDAKNSQAVETVLTVAICPSSPREEHTSETKYVPSLRFGPAARTLFRSAFETIDSKHSADFRGGVTDYAVPIQVEDGTAGELGYKVTDVIQGLPGIFPSPLHHGSMIGKFAAIVSKQGLSEFSFQTRPAQVTDGLSRTFMLTETAGRPQHWQSSTRVTAGEPLPSAWADPNGATFTIMGILPAPERCLIGCGNSGENDDMDGEIYSFHAGHVNFLFADGHVGSLSTGIEPRLLVSLMTPAGADNQNSK